MKKVFIVFSLAASLAACKSNDKKTTGPEVASNDVAADKVAPVVVNNETPEQPNPDNTTIQWLDSTFIDLGKKPEGKEMMISFRFKNTGDKPLVIKDVTASCGCTVPEKPEKPFAPGEEGVIKAKFNGIGSGEVRKDVHVTANTNPSSAHTLTFRTELVKK